MSAERIVPSHSDRAAGNSSGTERWRVRGRRCGTCVCEEGVLPCPPTPAAPCSRLPPSHRPELCVPNRWSAGGWRLCAAHKFHSPSALGAVRIRSHLHSRGVDTRIDTGGSGVRGHMGSGVTETHCSEEEEPCDGPCRGFHICNACQ